MNEKIQFWLNDKLAEIAAKLPQLAHENPYSFACGYNAGFKAALLELDRLMEDEHNAG